jgi:hypothetical protein
MCSHSNDNTDLFSKSTGFRMFFHHPTQIAAWVTDTCAYQGDRPAKEIRQQNEIAWEKFQNGISRRMVSGQRVWIQPFSADSLLDSVETIMRAVYSPTSGEGCDIVTYLSLASEALDEGLHWTLAQKSSDIVVRLRRCGLAASLLPDTDGSQGLLVAHPQGGSAVEVCLGFNTLTDALAGDFEVYSEADARDFIFGFIGDLALPSQRLVKDLYHFQVTLSYLVDSLYYVTNRQPPDMVMELSASTEAM